MAGSGSDGYYYSGDASCFYRLESDSQESSPIYVVDDDKRATNLIVIGGRLLFELYGEDGDYGYCEVWSTDLNGADPQRIYRVEEDATLSYASIEHLYVAEGDLIVVQETHDSSIKRDSYEVLRMGIQGENQEVICSVDFDTDVNTSDRTLYFTVTDSKIYHADSYLRGDYSNNSDDYLGAIYVQNLDGTGLRKLYESDEAAIGPLIPYGAALFFVNETRLLTSSR